MKNTIENLEWMTKSNGIDWQEAINAVMFQMDEKFQILEDRLVATEVCLQETERRLESSIRLSLRIRACLAADGFVLYQNIPTSLASDSEKENEDHLSADSYVNALGTSSDHSISPIPIPLRFEK